MIHILQRIIEKMGLVNKNHQICTQEAYTNERDSFFEPLTPTDQADQEGIYAKAILWALESEESKHITNIALTGSYGSGKSSILKSFQKKYPNKKYKFLNISLATFKEECVTHKEQQHKEAGTRDRNVLNLIELSILQQIFYHAKNNKIPDSRFKKINHISRWKLLRYASFFTLWFCTLIFLWYPQYLDQDIFITHKKTIHLVSISIVVLGCYFIIVKLIRLFNSSKINKLNIQSGEIEFNKGLDRSILNHHLDEILYFFEATKYNIVIIEDLDRFEQTEIFTKLRELNILINNSLQIGKKVVFIYAIKDDMFTDKDRTKFFDFIIPVVSVINISNSKEKLSKKLKKINSDISNDLIEDISLFIGDMRLLKNISNEYIIYREIIKEKKLETHVLATIVYKNMYPEDFAKLHNNEGLVYDVFAKKEAFIATEINRIKTKIKEKEHELEKRSKFHQDNQSQEQQITTTQEELEHQIDQLKQDIQNIKAVTLQELLEKNNTDDLLQAIKDEKLILILLRNGYINENYHDYISHFYEGSLSMADRDFMINIKSGIPSAFDKPLVKIPELVKRANNSYFSKPVILNFSLLDFLLQHIEQAVYEDKAHAMLNLIAQQTSAAALFFEEYIDRDQNIPSFIKHLCNKWPAIWHFITSQSQYSTQKKELLLKHILQYATIQDIGLISKQSSLANDIAVQETFLEWTKHMEEKVILIIQHLDITFKKIRPSTVEATKVFHYIVNHNRYTLTAQTIALIIDLKGKHNADLQDALNQKHYTTIKASGITSLIEYVETHSNDYIENVFLQIASNTEETEETILELFNKDAITQENKMRIIEKQNTKITAINNVHESLWEHILDQSKGTPTWNMVKIYFDKKGLDLHLISFLNIAAHYRELCKEKLHYESLTPSHKHLLREIILCTTLSIESLEQLLESYPLIYYKLDIKTLTPEKVLLVLKRDLLVFNAFHYNVIKQGFAQDSLHLSFLIKHTGDFLAAENINEFEVDNHDFEILLKEKKITVPQKIELIKLVDDRSSLISTSLSHMIIKILLKLEKNNDFSEDFLLRLLETSTKKDLKKDFYQLYLNHLNEGTILKMIES